MRSSSPDMRARWLPDGELRKRTATRPKSARFDWGDDGPRAHVTFAAKGDDRSTMTLPTSASPMRRNANA